MDAEGLEPTSPDPSVPKQTCVRVPQAFHSKDEKSFPLIGFQFHPEQRDLRKLDPRSPRDARGDALNVIANALALVLDRYELLFWPTN